MRRTLPNVGRITEMIKVAAFCETQAVGIVPQVAGSISTACSVRARGPFSGSIRCEIGGNTRIVQHISERLDFRKGQLRPNSLPGLGVTLNLERLIHASAIADPGAPRPIYFQPDGAPTSW